MTATTAYERMNSLSDRELAYIARWVALTNTQVADRGMEALAAFKRDHPDKARLLFGAEAAGQQ